MYVKYIVMNFSLMFNENKLVCIKFSKVVTDNNIADVYLGENKLKWDNKVKHLGNFLSSTQSDKDDIDSKINSFIVSVNTLMAKFGFLQSNILDFLFNSYCCSFYGSQSWELTSRVINKVYVTWQKAIRRIRRLPNTTPVRLLNYISCTQKHISEQLLYRFINFFRKCYYSNNKLVCACKFVNFDMSDVSVNTNIVTANNNNVKHLSNICQQLSNVIKECCDIRDYKLILVNFGTENIKEIINMICTD